MATRAKISRTKFVIATMAFFTEGTGEFWQFWERASPKDRVTLTIIAGRIVEGTERKK